MAEGFNFDHPRFDAFLSDNHITRQEWDSTPKATQLAYVSEFVAWNQANPVKEDNSVAKDKVNENSIEQKDINNREDIISPNKEEDTKTEDNDKSSNSSDGETKNNDVQ